MTHDCDRPSLTHPGAANQERPEHCEEQGFHVDAIDVPHPAWRIGKGRLDDQVVVVRHLAVRLTDPGEALNYVVEQLEERNSVTVREEDLASIVATTRDVIECAFELDSHSTSRAPSLVCVTPNIKT